MQPLQLRLQGLWVGAALGELYAHRLLNNPGENGTLTVATALPQTYRLCLLSARRLKGLEDARTDGWRNLRWQDSLLNLLPLTFLHPAGSQGLIEAITAPSTLASLPPPHQERMASAVALIQTLEWFCQGGSIEGLLPYLYQAPLLLDTPLADSLRKVEGQIHDRRGLPLFREGNQALEDMPDRALSQVLYLLLSTPEDFRLTVERGAVAIASQTDLMMLLGGLSGFYTGFHRLPLRWRWRLKTVRWSIAVPFEEGLCTFADRCVARWSGCYGSQPVSDWANVAVAAAGQLRPR